MKKPIKSVSAVFIFAGLLACVVFSQESTPANVAHSQSFSAALHGVDYVALRPELAKSVQQDGIVTIPFTLTNTSDKDVLLGFVGDGINALAFLTESRTFRYIQNLNDRGNSGMMSGEIYNVVLKPGESTDHLSISYSSEILAAVKDRKIFGVLNGWAKIAGKLSPFICFSEPFAVPALWTKLPWNDLGVQSYLSLTPDLANAGFSGGHVWIPITMKNTSSQSVIVAIDEVRFFIMGDDREKKRLLHQERREFLKIATPVLKPGESISTNVSGRDYITLKFLETEGYKAGDKIVALAGGRILNTNSIFECYSAPFELPPLPKGEPPAGK
jgi:hypothetical protein